MAWTLGTPITASSTAGAAITTGAADTTGVIAFIVFVSNYGVAAQCTVTDSKSNTWTARTAFGGGGSDTRVRCYYCIPASVGAGHTFTADSGDTSFPSIMILPITAGADTSTFFDKDVGNTGNNTVQASSSQTPTNAGALVIAALSYEQAGTPTVNESYDAPTIVTFSSGNNVALAVARWIQTSATATQPTWTEGGSLSMTVAIFNPGGGGVGGLPFFMQGDVRHGYKQQRSGGMQ